ncbi:Xaa-Pro dipeptidase [Lentibacillus sp. JNUCC-1]|uniref:M24 family metallopeptidase n=1 Tax=Lentibacillus sp. JNUCC-1 TaxID=2654513 RepID=UPI0012E8D926|nr:Xaa-Pro peptidase family protein [Lentibacillus sp. JNUCC-1]MUV38822.1 Xaa-Pro dipeptidase [Lentibacillus sp. JNUCC-1]
MTTKEEEQPDWIGRRMGVNGAKLTTWLDESKLHYYTDEYLYGTGKHPMDIMSDLLKKLNQDKKRIGVEMGSYHFSAIQYETLKKRLPDATFCDATTLVGNVRMIKSNQELHYMRNAANNAEHAMQTALESLGKGVPENQVVADIYQAQLTGFEGVDGDYPSIVPFLLSGVKTSSPHLTWGNGVFRGDELVTLELAGVHKRYHSPLSRTFKLGNLSEEEKHLADAVKYSLNTTLEAIEPGKTCGDITRVWVDAIKEYGHEKYDRLGYSVGFSYPPNWDENTASIRLEDQTVLQPNMTFHLIPGIWEEDRGVELSETFVVTEDGCETLAEFPRKVFEI